MSTEIAVAVVEWKGRFLVGVRDMDAELGGYDEFPGGKVTLEETPAQAAERECLEETGVDVEALELFVPVIEHTYAHGDLRLHFFRCRPTPRSDALPKPPFRWVDREELSRLRFPEANQTLLDVLIKPDTSPTRKRGGMDVKFK